MKRYSVMWSLLILAIPTIVQGAVAFNDTIMVQDQTVGMPAQIVSVEVAPGVWSWSLSGNDNFSCTLVIIGIRADRAIAAKDIVLSADYKDPLNIKAEGKFDYPAYKRSATKCVTCQDNSTPIDLSPNFFMDARHNKRDLLSGDTYYSTFFLPLSLAYRGSELNHISLSASDSVGVVSGGMWIYHSNGNKPEAGSKGIRPEDGHILIKRIGTGNNWTISS